MSFSTTECEAEGPTEPKDRVVGHWLYHLQKMLELDRELYERILDTPGFSYHFNQLCRLARGDGFVVGGKGAIDPRE